MCYVLPERHQQKHRTRAKEGCISLAQVPAGRRRFHQDRLESQQLKSRQAGKAQVLTVLVRMAWSGLAISKGNQGQPQRNIHLLTAAPKPQATPGSWLEICGMVPATATQLPKVLLGMGCWCSPRAVGWCDWMAKRGLSAFPSCATAAGKEDRDRWKEKKSLLSSRAGGWKSSPTLLTEEKKWNERNTSNTY